MPRGSVWSAVASASLSFIAMNSLLSPKRTVAELKELRSLTGNDHGAQRVAFTQTWLEARAWLRNKLKELPVEVRTDAAGNLWATLRGSDQNGPALF